LNAALKGIQQRFRNLPGEGISMRNQWLKTLVPAMALAALPAVPTVSHAGVAIGVSITVAPPVLPVYVQPPLPEVGYIWTPGYWAWGGDDYYWVPGTWVLPPSPGVLWTPGYWGWANGAYLWHAGYWGPHIGFYGGVNYGFGYTGVGFQGGYWRGGAFFYNRSVCNVGAVHVTNVYNRTVINNVSVNRVSFNGGAGGLHVRPTAHELSAEHERHFEPTSLQRDHQHFAATNRDLRESVNHGRPAIAATSRPNQFSGHGVVAARGSSGPRGGPVNEMGHNDRPTGAHGPENRGGAGSAGHFGPENRGGPAAAASHVGPENRGGPGSGGRVGPENRGGPGSVGRVGAESHGGPVRDTAHNDRPPGAHAPENQGAPGSVGHAGPENRGGPGAPNGRPNVGGSPVAHNDFRSGGPSGGFHPNPGASAPHPTPHMGGQPRPGPNVGGGGGGRPNANVGGGSGRPAPNFGGGGRPPQQNISGGGRPPQGNGGNNGHRPEGHR
jgi:hypothetical protein